MSPGTVVQLSNCAGNPSELWTMTSMPGQPGELRTGQGKLCLTGSGQGPWLTIQNCTGGSNQLWTVTTQQIGPPFNNGGEITQGGLCLNVIQGATTPGSVMTLWPCQTDSSGRQSTNEVWRATAQSQLRSSQSFQCLNVAGGQVTAGGQLIIWPCVGTPNELFSLNSTGELVGAQSGLCVSAGGQGSVVTMQACDGDPGQLWTFNTQGELVQAQSGQCLNVRGGVTSAGTALTVWPCVDSPNEVWTQVSPF
jgi:hypothetical protein